MIRHRFAVGRAQGTRTRRGARRALGLVAAATTAVAVLPLAAPGTTAEAAPAAVSTTALAAASTPSVSGPAPSITGTVVVGSVLTAVPGTWSPAPVTLSYQWYRSGTAITGATARTYLLKEADRTSTITLVVVGRKSGHAARGHISAATTKVLGRLVTYRPHITSEMVVGRPYSTAVGTWGPGAVRYSCHWNRDGVALPTSPQRYEPTTADIGHVMSFTVVGRKDGYAARALTSNAVRVFGQFDAPQPEIRMVRGTNEISLVADVGTWSPTPTTLRYQWYRAYPTYAPIPGATSGTYVLTPGDERNYLQVKVVGSRQYYLDQMQPSEFQDI